MSRYHSLIVRVKRRRDQEPVNSLCIVEDDLTEQSNPKKQALDTNKITSLLSSLSTCHTQSNITNDRGQILLSRVLTTTSSDKEHFTSPPNIENTISSNIDTDSTYNYDAKSSLWIPHGKRLHRSASTAETMLLVDIHQEHRIESSSLSDNVSSSSAESNLYVDPISQNLSEHPSTSSSSATRIKVFDPASRTMDDAIDKAWRVGDFNGIANALQRGANANFQRDMVRYQGITALMAAVKHCNLRMVNRLLENGVDVSTKNASKMDAMDILHNLSVPDAKQRAYMDINIVLHKAVTKKHLDNIRRQQHDQALNDSLAGVMEVDYVYDIFRYQAVASNKRSRDALEINTESDIGSHKLAAPIPSISATTPIVAVPGITICQDGNVDLVFAYDSDWSELGDEDDVDSNDERYVGNDYPEDEDGDGEPYVGREDDGGDSMDGISKQLEDREFDKAYGDDDSEEGDATWNRFGRGDLRVGHVSKYTVAGADDVDQTINRDTKSLQRLWKERDTNNDDEEEDDEGDNDHGRRLEGMHHASGMEFASNPLEFDRHGLPKYGFDLDDDNEGDGYDMLDSLNRARLIYESRIHTMKPVGTSIGGYHARYVSEMPPRDTLAYDPEYDDY